MNHTHYRLLFLIISLVCIALPFCATAQDSETKNLLAGAATSNITLPLGAKNGGVIARGAIARNVHDEMHARCLVLDDGSTKIAIAICDLRMFSREVCDEAKQIVADATGIPNTNILISATHTHAAPAVIGMHTAEIDRWYQDFVVRRIADGIQRAHENRAPAKVGRGSASVPGQVFNRRWFMKEGGIGPDPFGREGAIVRTNPPRTSELLDKPAGPADPEVAILSIQHADGRPLAILANYGVHYIGGYKGNYVSADYFGVFSERIGHLLKAEGYDPLFVAMMSNGTSGDTNNINFRQPRKPAEPWSKMREVGYEIAEAVEQVYQTIEHRDDITLAVANAELELGVRKPDAERIAWAKEVITPKKGVTAAKIKGREIIYAQEALELQKFPDTVSVSLQAIRIGDLGITAIPCEVFAETGIALKKQNPLTQTFTIELANGYNGYLPTAQQHEWGGYETLPARSSYLEVDAETEIRKTVLDLLKQLAGE